MTNAARAPYEEAAAAFAAFAAFAARVKKYSAQWYIAAYAENAGDIPEYWKSKEEAWDYVCRGAYDWVSCEREYTDNLHNEIENYHEKVAATKRYPPWFLNLFESAVRRWKS
jgi:hypothetical protein